jgi:adhesin transport system outer membrane protein
LRRKHYGDRLGDYRYHRLALGLSCIFFYLIFLGLFHMNKKRLLFPVVLFWALNLHAETTLPALLKEAITSYPALRAQRELGEAARAGVEGARWQFYPTPSVALEYANTAAGDTNHRGDDHITVLRLQQPLWTGGRLSGNLNKAEAVALIAQADYESARQQLAVRLIQAWGEGSVALAKLKALEQSARTHARLLAQVTRRNADGFSAQSDIDLARGRLDATEAEVSSAKVQRDMALAKLGNLVGRPLAKDILPDSFQPSVIDKEIHGSTLDSLSDMAWQGSPQRIRAEAQIQQASAEIDVAGAALWPEVYLRAERQHGNYAAGGLPPQNRLFIGLNTALGAGLSAQSTIDAARARQRAAQDDLLTQRLAVVEQVQIDHALVASAAQRRVILQRSLAANVEVFASWERQFLAGRKQWQDLMNAAREQAAAEAQLADAIGAEAISRWRLLVVTRGVDAVVDSSRGGNLGLSGRFILELGALGGTTDLGKVRQDRGMGEETRFESLGGNLVVKSQRFELSALNLVAADLKGSDALNSDTARNANDPPAAEPRSESSRDYLNLKITGNLAAPNYQR